MKEAIVFYEKNKNKILMLLGLLIVSLIVVPSVFLGEGTYVEVHDQLDGEVLNYIYGAKYLFRGNVVPEFMNGMSKAAMAMPAPFGVLFYRVLPAFAAFTAMQWMGVLVAFAGMFNLCGYFRVKEEIGFAVALLFAFMPFYPVYGLAAYGQPLLLLCALQLGEKNKRISSLAGILLYAGFSSLTLVGYVWVALGALYLAVLLLRKEQKEKVLYSALGWLVLTVTYCLTNLDLLGSVLGKGFESHRSEMVLHFQNNVIQLFTELFFKGGAYSKTYSVGIFVVAVFTLCLEMYIYRKNKVLSDTMSDTTDKNDSEKLLGKMIFTCLSVGVFTILAILWNCGAVVSLRKTIGGIITYFQADRVYWIFPFLWMLILAFTLQLLYEMQKRKKKMILRFLCMGLMGAVLLIEGGQILRDSTLNKNLRLLLLPAYKQITWQSFYMNDVFEQIDEELVRLAMENGAEDESIALEQIKKETSAVSIGLYPSIPLYHGYTCADGYSNNYELSYKHKFREIFAEELEQSEAMKAYFDDWGNRLYLADASYGFQTLLGKDSGAKFEELRIDTEAMKKLNIGYVFSAAPIENADALGLTRVGDGGFSSEISYYEIWVYLVNP